MRDAFDVQHQPAQQRFVTVIDGVEGVLDYEQRDGMLCLTHTGVPSQIGGRGVGGALVHTALEYARSKGLKIVPSCAYVAAYIARNPQYRDLVAS